MSENLLDMAPVQKNSADIKLDIPEKFRDEAGNLRVEALLKSYLELERTLARRLAAPADDAPEEERARWRRLLGVPEAPEGYEIKAHELCGPDPEVNKRLHEAGFTCRQAQLVYDLAAERLLPLIAEAASEFEAGRQREKLAAEFGGEERFRRLGEGEPVGAGVQRPLDDRRGRGRDAPHDGREGTAAVARWRRRGRARRGGAAPDDARPALLAEPRAGIRPARDGRLPPPRRKVAPPSPARGGGNSSAPAPPALPSVEAPVRGADGAGTARIANGPAGPAA